LVDGEGVGGVGGVREGRFGHGDDGSRYAFFLGGAYFLDGFAVWVRCTAFCTSLDEDAGVLHNERLLVLKDADFLSYAVLGLRRVVLQ